MLTTLGDTDGEGDTDGDAGADGEADGCGLAGCVLAGWAGGVVAPAVRVGVPPPAPADARALRFFTSTNVPPPTAISTMTAMRIHSAGPRPRRSGVGTSAGPADGAQDGGRDTERTGDDSGAGGGASGRPAVTVTVGGGSSVGGSGRRDSTAGSAGGIALAGAVLAGAVLAAIAATPKSRPQPPQYRASLRCRPHVGQ
jgi:hypothetical protein